MTDDKKIDDLLRDIPVSRSIIHQTVGGNRTWPDETESSLEMAQLINSSFEAAFGDGHRKILGIFSLPGGITPELIREAFLSLRPLDFCLGPDPDGGIWLLGMNRHDPSVITGMPWQSRTLAKTITRAIGQQKKILYRLPYL